MLIILRTLIYRQDFSCHWAGRSRSFYCGRGIIWSKSCSAQGMCANDRLNPFSDAPLKAALTTGLRFAFCAPRSSQGRFRLSYEICTLCARLIESVVAHQCLFINARAINYTISWRFFLSSCLGASAEMQRASMLRKCCIWQKRNDLAQQARFNALHSRSPIGAKWRAMHSSHVGGRIHSDSTPIKLSADLMSVIQSVNWWVGFVPEVQKWLKNLHTCIRKFCNKYW